MIHKLILIGLLLFAYNPLFAQAPTFAWVNTYGSGAYTTGVDMIPLTNGGGYVSLARRGDATIYLVRTTLAGDTLWTRKFRLPRVSLVYPRGICQDQAGNLLIAGIANNPTNPTFGIEPFVLKCNLLGDTLRSRIIREPYSDAFVNPRIGNDGNLVVSATWHLSQSIIKLNINTLDIIWTSPIPSFGLNSTYITHLQKLPSGYFAYADGGYRNAVLDERVFRLDEDGTILSTHAIPFYVNGSSVDLDGNVLICGDGLAKINPATSDTLWYHHYQRFSRSIIGRDVRQAPDGSYILLGDWNNNTNRDIVLWRLDHEGRRLRDTILSRFSSEDIASRLAIAPDGDYVLAGTFSTSSEGEIVLAKFRQWRTPLGIKGSTSPFTQLTIYPNPGHSNLRLQCPKQGGQLQILDTEGKILFKGDNNLEQELALELLEHLPPKLYLITYLLPDGSHYSFRFCKI